mmetsp:Transcript_4356/g.11971  ORF Transcript_4356/g.11971 Transcript_4356/m.11971 type:complete len:109 (+) Transcript_4356:81-407(+)
MAMQYSEFPDVFSDNRGVALLQSPTTHQSVHSFSHNANWKVPSEVKVKPIHHTFRRIKLTSSNRSTSQHDLSTTILQNVLSSHLQRLRQLGFHLGFFHCRDMVPEGTP